ncbi:MAG: hypothetical protein G5Z42_05030 [Caldisphaeraceae archaeon]|nr:hypothetical protein [Caldisphaeraceae archaeon]
MHFSLLSIPIILFFFGGLAIFPLKRSVADALSLIISGLSLAFESYGVYMYFSSNQVLTIASFYTHKSLGLIFGLTVDSASVIMGLLLTIIAFLIFIYSIQFMKKTQEESSKKGFLYGWMSIALAASLFAIYSISLIQLIISLEVMAVAFALLVNFYGINKGKGWKLLVIQNLAVILLLFVLGYTHRSSLYLMSFLSPHEKIIAFILMLFAAFTMSSQFFFYSWLPDSTQAPIPVTALIHSVTLVNVGIIFFLRIVQFMELPKFAFNYVWPFTVAMIILMIIYYPLQKDAKKLLAYTTISQAAISYTTISYGILGQQIGLQVGFYQMINHSIIKVIAFLSVGFFIYYLGTSDFEKIKGIRKILPAASVAWFLSFFGLAGILPLGLFFGKMFTIMATMHGIGFTTRLIPLVILLDSGVFLLVVIYWFKDIFFGEPTLIKDLSVILRRPQGLMVASVIVLIILGSVLPWVSLGLAKRIVFINTLYKVMAP